MTEETTGLSGMEALRAIGRTRRFRNRQTIFSRGDPGDFLAIVESGVARISLFNPDGRELALALVGPGEMIGEIGVLDRQPRTADAIAIGAVELCVVSAAEVQELIRSRAEIASFFIALLCERLRGANLQAEGHALSTLAGRLALQLLNRGQEAPDGSLVIPALPSQSELARLVGSARESVNRQFRLWEQAGLLAPQADGFVVPDPVALQGSAAASG